MGNTITLNGGAGIALLNHNVAASSHSIVMCNILQSNYNSVLVGSTVSNFMSSNLVAGSTMLKNYFGVILSDAVGSFKNTYFFDNDDQDGRTRSLQHTGLGAGSSQLKNSCTSCAEGKFTSTVSSTFCSECAMGVYASTTGSARCAVCRPRRQLVP
jgi:hypothetical protein